MPRSRNVLIQSGQYRAADLKLEDKEHRLEAEEVQRHLCSEP